MTPLVGILTGLGDTLIKRLWPDPADQAKAQLELFKLQQSGELALLAADTQLATKQLDVNAVEAANPNLFVSGWRPSVGWVSAAGFAIQFIVGPLCEWGSALYGHPIPFPKLDLSEMMPILLGMLGIGGLRSYEKIKGVTK
jgi:hypothetical protein